jgi:hypothetical protein
MATKNKTQTEQEFLKLYDDLVLDATKKLLDYGRKALLSGAVSLEQVRGPHRMPKNVLTAGLLTLTGELGPPEGSIADLRDIANIRRCV